jgi:hypothetical protein
MIQFSPVRCYRICFWPILLGFALQCWSSGERERSRATASTISGKR